MSRRFRMTTALDVDDVLLECVPYAIKLANEKYNFDPPLTIYEIDRWGKLGTRADVIFEFFTEEFFKVLESANAKTLTEIQESSIKKMMIMANAFRNTDKETKEMLVRLIKQIFS